ncbi:hypothetical protein KY346_06440 [Candidatus Woesearchaeota archaeon]|nr:hypothetical protein [Candidatus Woesearchaeota archaeon]
MKLKPGIGSEMYQFLFAQMLDHNAIIYIGDTVRTVINTERKGIAGKVVEAKVTGVHFDGVMMAEMDDAKYILDVQGKRHYAGRMDLERISQTPKNEELEESIREAMDTLDEPVYNPAYKRLTPSSRK